MGTTIATSTKKRRQRHHRNLVDQIKSLKNEQQAREDAKTALVPDFWEINRPADRDDGYRILEREWRQQHMSVQLNSSPRYRTVFPSDAKLAEMKKHVAASAATRQRRLSKRHRISKS